MAYVTIPGKSGYCVGANPGASGTTDGGLRMYWELRCYTSQTTETIMGKSYSCAAGSYKLFYRLEGWHGITYDNLVRLIARTNTSNASYVEFRNGSKTLWSMDGVARSSSWGSTMSPGFGKNNPAAQWYSVQDATYSSRYKVYPSGLISVSEGSTLSLNLTYSIGLMASSYIANKSNVTSSSTSVAVSGGKFSLSISQGAGSIATVKRGSTSLSNGATIYLNDSLSFTYAADTGYTIGSHTVNGTSRSSGYSWTVSGNATVVTTATPTPYTLDLQPGTGTTIAISRTSSPIGGGASGILNDGDTVYYNDVLTITFSPQTGYTITETSVTGATQSGDSWTAGANDVVAVAAADPTEHTLTISEDTGAIISVSRTASPVGGGATGALSDGDAVYYSDVLSVTFGAGSGYAVTTRTINGAAAQSGSYTAPDDDVVIEETTTAYFGLSIQTNTGAIVAVSRTASPSGHGAVGQISDGATIYDGDSLSISFTLTTGYKYTTKTINGTAVSGTSATRTVSSNVVVVGLAAVLSYLLTLNPGTGTAISVVRMSSPLQGAELGPLTKGATIYFSDTLRIVFSVSNGYTIATRTLNGVPASEVVNWAVTAPVSCAATATLNVYQLTITASSSGVVTTIVRTSSPNNPDAVIGQLGNGASIYYGDALVVTYSLAAGYTLEEATINGEAFASGDWVTATGSVAVVVLAKAAGFVYINNEPCLVWIGNGATYDRYLTKIGNGSTYDDY